MSLPPLNGLLALEATIRLGSVRRAAEELCISQPAVSQRLRALEAHFGRPLITRTPTGFMADPEVERYAGRLQRALAELAAASDDFRRRGARQDNRLSLALLATLAQRWLIPRLTGFQNRHPEIDVQLMTTSDPGELGREDADLSIRCGAGAWPGHEAHPLIANRIFPVASPRLLAELPLDGVGSLNERVLIRVDAPPRRQDWDLWCAAQGLPPVTPRGWQSYASSSHALEAATAGLGIAITHTPFAAESLAAGHLVRPFAFELPDMEGDYYLVRRRARAPGRAVTAFTRWLLDGSGGEDPAEATPPPTPP